MKTRWVYALGLGILMGCSDPSLCGNSDYAALCPNNYPPGFEYDAAASDSGTVVDASIPVLLDASRLDGSLEAGDGASVQVDASDSGR